MTCYIPAQKLLSCKFLVGTNRMFQNFCVTGVGQEVGEFRTQPVVFFL